MIAIPLVVGVVVVLLFGIERVAPLRRQTRPLLHRLVINICTAALALGAAAVFVRPAALNTLGWASDGPFGLIHALPVPPAAQSVVAFLLLDLSFYWWHVANHRVAVLWRFHNVHHIDPDLDVSTAFRFHFGEIALSTVFRVLQVVLIGPTAWTFAVYEAALQSNTAFHHSNVRLPIGLERVLNLVLVTPRMHGIHHSQVRDETNSNFSVVICWWDRLHRTIRLNIRQSSIVVGVPAYSADGDHALADTLLLPFRKQREYWRRPDGTVVTRDAVNLPSDARLAE